MAQQSHAAPDPDAGWLRIRGGWLRAGLPPEDRARAMRDVRFFEPEKKRRNRLELIEATEGDEK